MKTILVAIDDVNDAAKVMPKVVDLATSQAAPTNLAAVRVVYEGLADLPSKYIDGAPELKRFILEAEAPVLRGALEQTTDIEVECITLWNQRNWQGILHAQESSDASLIIKQVSEPSTSVYLKTPDDWNLIRHSTVPVLLSHSAWSKNRSVIAAVDVYDTAHSALNLRILENAKFLCERLNARLQIVSVVPEIGTWVDHVSISLTHAQLKKDIELEISHAITSLCESCDIEEYEVTVCEGPADLEIEALAASTSVVVVGTKSRDGVSGYVLGNTSEKILHKVKTDVLAVP